MEREEVAGFRGNLFLLGLQLAPAPPRNAVEHHKVLLVPVQDGGQRGLMRELLHVELSPQSAEANALGGAANAQHGYSLAGDVAPLPQRFEAPLPPVVPRHHAQTGGPAVHGIVLGVVDETHWRAFGEAKIGKKPIEQVVLTP